MDLVISIVGMTIPILTNWVMVTYTKDIVLVTLADILVLVAVDHLTQRMRRGLSFKGYVEFDSFRALPIIPVLIVVAGMFFFFLAMHSGAGKYRCSGFTLLLPVFYNPLFGILYLVGAGLLVLYFLPKVESVFYQNFFHYNDSIIVVILAGILAGAKCIWMIEATYGACGGNLAWIYILWIVGTTFTQWVQFKDFEDGLAVRQTLYLGLFIGATLLYGEVSFVSHHVTRNHHDNAWNKIF